MGTTMAIQTTYTLARVMNLSLSDILDTLSVKERAEVWCSLNLGVWPPVLGTPVEELAQDVMFQIMEQISYKECLREWNSRVTTPELFDKWWGAHRYETHYLN